MATVFLKGGLGNQMFQYAAGLRLALKTGTSLSLDITYLNDRMPRRNFTPRQYSLDIFDIMPKFTKLSKLSNRMPIPGLWLGLDVLGASNAVREKDIRAFDPEILDVSGNSLLMGHWQSEKYFYDCSSAVRSAFTFKNPLTGAAADAAKKMASTNSVSLHVRRGDYTAFKNVQTMMGETNTSYYERGVAYIAERVNDPHFFIFSDDISWCKENLKINFPVTYLEKDTAGAKDEGHLELMSLCKHNIIANSTFSWWGAWLKEASGKIIIAPKQWYADGSAGTETIVPERWIKL